jgi:hypothetical protein
MLTAIDRLQIHRNTTADGTIPVSGGVVCFIVFISNFTVYPLRVVAATPTELMKYPW